MVDRKNERKLLVEGIFDKLTIPELIEAQGVTWETVGETGERSFAVAIEEMGGTSKLLSPQNLSVRLKDPTTRILGLVVDADDDPLARWRSIRQACLVVFPGLPEAIPKEGLVITNSSDKKFGVWIMPDNESRGMLETFLLFLAPNQEDELVRLAKSACQDAKTAGAPYKEVHRDKAEIHTWLAWQDEPGQQLHAAVQQRILDPNSEHAVPFASWFVDLFELE